MSEQYPQQPGTPPPTNYGPPPPPPSYPPVPPPPPKQPGIMGWIRRHPIWTAIIVLTLLAGFINNVTHGNNTDTTDTATPTPTMQQPTPTRAPAWIVVNTFSGHTHGKTAFFTVQPGWRLRWECTNSTVPDGATGAVGITAYDKAGKTLSGNTSDPTVATGHCPPSFLGTHGYSDVQHYGGTMYLDVYATGDWTIYIQVLKNLG